MESAKKWVKSAFHEYYKNKGKLLQLKSDYQKISIPGAGGQTGLPGHGSGTNGVEKSVLHYLVDKERIENAIKDCENKIAVVEKTLHHFTMEEIAKGKKHSKYIRCRFLKCMSYTRAAIECEISERASDYWIEEIFNMAIAIAEAEGYIKRVAKS